VVFIAGVEEGLLPHGKSMEDPERLEEERRLCYVGITRAMDMAVLTFAARRHSFGETSFRAASRFLQELPQQLFISLDLTATAKGKPGK
jgi:DNA helicase-2/ATP-dependent DNA helicase PcrA